MLKCKIIPLQHFKEAFFVSGTADIRVRGILKRHYFRCFNRREVKRCSSWPEGLCRSPVSCIVMRSSAGALCNLVLLSL